MRDEDEGTVPFLQVFFQPDAGFEVQMCGWVVEEEKGRFDKESFGKRYAHPPSTGHVLCAFVDCLLVEAKTSQDEGGTCLES